MKIGRICFKFPIFWFMLKIILLRLYNNHFKVVKGWIERSSPKHAAAADDGSGSKCVALKVPAGEGAVADIENEIAVLRAIQQHKKGGKHLPEENHEESRIVRMLAG
jgi:hypothetical protein